MRVRLRLDRLRDLLARSGISQNHWAIRLGLSRGHWSDLVNGKHPYPSAATRQRLLEAFAVPFDQLFLAEPEAGAVDAAMHAALSSRYLLDREIGAGGMGTVFQARDLRLARVVAVKVVSAEAVGGLGVRPFLQEVGHVARLQHPHIVPLFDAGDAAGSPFYVMPLCRDGSLGDLLTTRRRLGLAEALPIIRGIALALHHAHAFQVLHGDVKPGNVLLDAGHPYLADFGIARVLHREVFELGPPPGLDSSAGTPAYVSPEQASGQADLDPRSDLYSLGCVVFEMLGGRAPFGGRTTLETVAARFRGPPPDLAPLAPELPLGVVGAVARAMALDRADRPRSVADFVAELEREARSRAPALLVSTRLGVARAAGRARQRAAETPVLARTGRLLGGWARDVSHALRGLRRSRGMAATALLSLGLGIGANTAIFSLINALMLKSLPVREPQSLVRLHLAGSPSGATLTNPLWEALRDQQQGFTALAADGMEGFDLTTGGRLDRVLGDFVSGDFFPLLGVGPVLGRTLQPADDVRGCPAVAVLSHGFWRSRFGASPDVVGRSLTLNGHQVEIVGVLQPGFAGLTVGVESGFFLPLCSDAILRGPYSRLDQSGTWWLSIFGRIRPGLSPAQVTARLDGLAPGLLAATLHPQWSPDRQAAYLKLRFAVAPAATGVSGLRTTYRDSLFLMMAVVGVVLLIACANVANLLLARAAVRQRELAIRVGLGAGPGRLIRLLLTESLLLSVGGAALGCLFAVWGSRLLVRLLSTGTNFIALQPVLDARVLGFTAAVALVTGLLFGVVPAWRSSRVDPQSLLKSGGSGAIEGQRRWSAGKTLVVAQVALSMVLVVTAILLLGTWRRLATGDAGFRPEDVLLVRADLKYTSYPDSLQGAVQEEIRRRLQALPGVRSVSAALWTPLDGNSRNDTYHIEGYTARSPDDALVYDDVVGDGYFTTLGTALLGGRDFDARDRPGSPPVAIVNATFARRFFAGRSALGGHFTTSDTLAQPFEIVGVVEDVRYASLRDAAVPMAFFALGQQAAGAENTVFQLRMAGNPMPLIPTVLSAVAELNPGIVLSFRTLSGQVSEALVRERALATLAGFVGGLALLLATIGLYGLVSYGVTRREREIGLRMALGATGRSVTRLVLREVATLVLVGLGLGTLAALAATRLVAGFLYGLTATDLPSFMLALLALLAFGGAAGYLPARRAAKQDPMVTLRSD